MITKELDVYALNPESNPFTQAVYDSTLISLKLIPKDFVIPSGDTVSVTAYAKNVQSDVVHPNTGHISSGAIILDLDPGFLTTGYNDLQVEISDSGRVLVSFPIRVYCYTRLSIGDVEDPTDILSAVIRAENAASRAESAAAEVEGLIPVVAITDENKGSTTQVPSVKAVADFVDPIIKDAAQLNVDLSESNFKIDYLGNRKAISVYNDNLIGSMNWADTSIYRLGNVIPEGSMITTASIYGLFSAASKVYLIRADNGYIVKEINVVETEGTEKNITINHIAETDLYFCLAGASPKYVFSSDAEMGTVIKLTTGSLSSDGKSIALNEQPYNMIFSAKIYIIENNNKSLRSPKSVVTVSKDGTKDFSTINDALNYAYSVESDNNRVTILIYPGVYNEVCNILGQHYVSLIGINRDTCIIRNDSGSYYECPLRIEGNSYIANLSLIATHNNNPNLVVNGIVQYNPSYALHIDDRHFDDNRDYICTVENCYIYSEQNPSVGLGLDKNQTINIINCELVSNITEDFLNATGKLDSVWGWKPNGGSLFYHALYGGNYTDDNGYQKLVVKNCIIKNNANNVVFGEGGGMESQVELTFIGNSGWSDKNGASFVKGLNGATISPLSFGNNIDSMNYQV